MSDNVLPETADAPASPADWSSGELIDGKTEQIECPLCKESISIRARRCSHCGELLDETFREEEAAMEVIEHKRAAKIAAREAAGDRARGLLRPFRGLRRVMSARPSPDTPDVTDAEAGVPPPARP